MVVAVVVGSVVAPSGPAAPVGPGPGLGPVTGAAVAPCEPGPPPFASTPGADLVPEAHVSEDADPVAYVRWSGTVPSFDGLPLSVAVTVPCPGVGGAEAGALPTVAMLHGFTDDKTVWEETGKSDTILSTDRPGSNSRWNNIWFASQGYAVLTYTARGWHDSCGPSTPGATAEAPAPACAGLSHWIHLDDKRWEVRDVQWLTGALVASGIADPDRLAITGGSYGGAATASAALLDGNVVCGADPMPAALGPDPCEGRDDGELVPWTTPDGGQRLGWAAALPLYTFADLLSVLAPNGRRADRVPGLPTGSTTDPFGVPLASTIEALVLGGTALGTFAPRGTDTDADLLTTTDRMLAGDPFPLDEPLVAEGIGVRQAFTSPISTPPQGRVPIFWVQGLTDALFGGDQALALREHVRDVDPEYPITVFFGDLGHDYAAERQDDWDLVKDRMNVFLDHHLRPDRTPEPTPEDVTVSITRCLDPDAAQDVRTAEEWANLATDETTFSADVAPGAGRTSSATPGPAGAATDPISTATLGGPGSYKGCRIVEPATDDPTAVTTTFDGPDGSDLVLVGTPVVTVDLAITGRDAPVAVRLWDVTPDGERQGLVTRGVFRVDGAVDGDTQVAVPLAPQGYRFAAGHRLKVEVTANDEPYLLANQQPVELDVRGVALDLPTAPDQPGGDPAEAPALTPDTGSDDTGSDDGTPVALVVGGVAAVLAALGAGAWWWRRRTADDAPPG